MELITGTEEECEKRVAAVVQERIEHLLEKQESVVLAVPGGRSVSGIFSRLAKAKLDWKRIHLFMVDERLVPINNKESNFLLVEQHLLTPLIDENRIPLQNIHPFILEEKGDFGITTYREDLQQHGGKYDILLVSAGEDGHIGALYPGHASVKDESEYFITMKDSPKPPAQRMSAARRLLKRADTGIILFFGEGKQAALEKFKDERISVEACPARIIASLPNAYAATDMG